MIAVIFEVQPAGAAERDRYIGTAAALKPHLEHIDGFLSVERFESLTQPGKILSLSFFRDEEAVANWRALSRHRDAQRLGRGGLFESYRLRVAAVLRDYGLEDRKQAPPGNVQEEADA